MAIDLAEYRIARRLDELFSTGRYGELFENPVTGATFIYGDDDGDFRIEPQKEAAVRALLAREWFAIYGPADAPPLPLSHIEREDLKGTGLLPHMVAWYARSLENREYDVKEHPSFADYASGVLWEAQLPVGSLVTLPNRPPDEVQELKKRFPPRMLKGMSPGLYWEPPKEHAEAMASWRRRYPKIYFNRE